MLIHPCAQTIPTMGYLTFDYSQVWLCGQKNLIACVYCSAYFSYVVRQWTLVKSHKLS